jgi:hypothetical protein
MRAAILSFEEGITQGTDNHQLSSKANADRAQASSFLSRMLKKLHFIKRLFSLDKSVFLHIK